MTIINPTKDSKYYSQRNNKEYPHSACMPTSYAMASDHAGCLWPAKAGLQPEDRLMRFLRSKRGELYAKEKYPLLMKQGHYANEIHGVLPWAYKVVGGTGEAVFRTKWNIEELLWYVMQGYGVVMSGYFPHYERGHIHHVVCLGGFITSQRGIREVQSVEGIDLEAVDSFIIDDPYGDWSDGYRSHNGNNREIKKDMFIRIMKPYNELYKWAHVISRQGIRRSI